MRSICRWKHCSKTVVVPCSKRGKTDHVGTNRCSCKRLKNQSRVENFHNGSEPTVELKIRRAVRRLGQKSASGEFAGIGTINALLVRRSGTGSCFSPRQRRPLPMAKSKRKRVPKTVLKLLDLEQSKSAVLNSLTSSSSKRSYDHAIREFIEWYCSEPRILQQDRGHTVPNRARTAPVGPVDD